MLKKIQSIFLVVFLLSFAVTRGLFSYYLCYNIYWTRNFDQVEGVYNYADAVKEKTIDLDEISNLFTDIVALYGYPDYKETIISPVNIEYYENKGDKSPAYVIEKGESIHFELLPKTKSRLQFRGNDSIPTVEKGWRIARPFKVDAEEKDSLWYVRLEDLFCVSNEWLKENPDFTRVASREVMSMGLFPTKRNISEVMLLFVDHKLYSEGIFLSRDLFKPIFTGATLISLFVTIISLVLYIFTKKRL